MELQFSWLSYVVSILGTAIAFVFMYYHVKRRQAYSPEHRLLFKAVALIAIFAMILFPLIETSPASDQDFVKILIQVTVQLLVFAGVILGIAPALYQRSGAPYQQTRHLIAEARASALAALIYIIGPLWLELLPLRGLEGTFVVAVPGLILPLLSGLTFALEFTMIFLGFGFLVLSIFRIYQAGP
jgi:hypothetical protein